jgi:TPR repeat protein
MRTVFLTVFLALASPVLLAAELGEAYVKLFRVQLQLANTGHPGAQYSIGEMYEQGLGTPDDMAKAYEWYEKAAKQGDVRAKHKLATRGQQEDVVVPKAVAREAAAPKPVAPRAPAPKAPPARPSVAEIEKMRAEAEAILEKQRQRGAQGEIGW